jgi:thiol-disulfide isomerase/thioredoxin
MRSLMILFAFGAVAFGIYLGVHRSHSHAAITATAAPALAAAPELIVTDLSGDALHTANYKGKVVLVNFWAAWCTPCAEEVPQFIALQKKYQDQGLQVIGFSGGR